MSTPEAMRQALEPTADLAWTLCQTGFDPLRDGSQQSRFAISNGFLGVPGGRAINRDGCNVVPALTYVAGLFDTLGAEQPLPGLVPAADWLRTHVSLTGDALAPHPDSISFHSRTLDLRRGVLLTEGHLARDPGVAIRWRVMRLVSLDERAIGMQLIRMEVEAGEVEITFEASFDALEFGLVTERLEQDLGVWRTNASGKRLAMTAATSLRIDGDVLLASALGPFKQAWTWKTHPGQVAWFERTVAIVRTDTPDRDPGRDARDKLGIARALGWRDGLARHQAAWCDRWDCSDVEVEGDAAAQQSLRFAAYHLNSAANPHDERVSIAARALTGADYRGHVFWDTEIFLLPFYIFTWPEAARTLLMYRFRTLDGARAKAAGMGWRGALYAWESADIGAETTPEHAVGPDRKVVPILCGKQEQHISADVAFAVWQYWLATGDEAFLLDAGAEILLETARFWASRAMLEADGRHHIRGVIGPDEYHETIDDNAFTNVMARWNMRRAIEVAALMRERWPARWDRLSSQLALNDTELRQWSTVAETMATGLNPRTGLFEQFEGYFAREDIDLSLYSGRSVPIDVVLGRKRTEASQIVKQADVVALLALLPDEFAGDGGAANFAYYEPRCSHGSSLSRAMHGWVAARLGRSDMALDFFRQNSAIDLADTHAAIDGGVHIAALGGVWMTAVLGFAGLSLRDGGIALHPQLPRGWRSLRFSLQWRGRHLTIRVHPAQFIEATLRAGETMSIFVGGLAHELRAGLPLHISTDRPRQEAQPHVQATKRTTPPSTRRAAPVVAEACSEHT